MNTRQEISVLDLGTDTICASIIRPEKKDPDNSIAIGNTMRVLGIGYQLAKGIKRGAITNLEELEDAIIGSIQSAEKESQRSIRSLFVAVPAWTTKSYIVNNSIEIGQIPVDDIHIKTLSNFDSLKDVGRSDRIIHVFPISYSIDDNHGILDPIGMVGRILSAVFHVVSIQSSFVQNIKNCLDRNNIAVEEFICSTYASSLSVLLDDELSSGATLIDIGGSMTSICSVADGLPVYMSSIPVGSQNITNDIAMVLKTTKSNSERLKILYGVSPGNTIDEAEQILVSKVDEYGEEHVQSISKSMLDSIIIARLEEMLELVQEKIYRSGIDKFLYQRLVITGGGSRISGLSELIKAKRYFNELSVRLGKPIGTTGSHDFVQTASFATSAGVVLHHLRSLYSSPAMGLLNKKRSLAQMLVTWFKRGI
jgi:cell division protein FtsA